MSSTSTGESVTHTKEVVFQAYRAQDVPEIARIVCEEIPKMPAYKDLKTSPRRVEYLLNHNLTNAEFMCVVVWGGDKIVGGVAGQTAMLAFSEDKIAIDLFLFVQSEHRSPYVAGVLIETYTKWAKARRCTLITASHRSGEGLEGMERLLRRHKYELVGSNYHLRDDK